jgi:hypothetical protein
VICHQKPSHNPTNLSTCPSLARSCKPHQTPHPWQHVGHNDATATPQRAPEQIETHRHRLPFSRPCSPPLLGTSFRHSNVSQTFHLTTSRQDPVLINATLRRQPPCSTSLFSPTCGNTPSEKVEFYGGRCGRIISPVGWLKFMKSAEAAFTASTRDVAAPASPLSLAYYA